MIDPEKVVVYALVAQLAQQFLRDKVIRVSSLKKGQVDKWNFGRAFE